MTIPEGVKTIGNKAFRFCFSLESIIIPESVEIIGESAFANTEGIETISIPSSVTSIGMSVLSFSSSLQSINVDPQNSAYHSDGNCLIENERKILIAGCNNSVIPSDGSVKEIGPGAFGGGVFTEFSIPEGVEVIDRNAFESSKLKKISLPDSLSSICQEAFSYCEALERISIPNNVTFIGMDAFSNCKSLKSVTIPDGVTTLEGPLFAGCKSLTEIVIPKSVKTINNAFYKCPARDIFYMGTSEEWSEVILDSYAAADISSKTLHFLGGIKPGDVNYDGKTNSKDAKLLKLIIAGKVKFTVGMSMFADVNIDGEINLKDVIILRNKLAGIK